MPHPKSSTESLACRFHRNLNSRSKDRKKGNDFRMKTKRVSHYRCESFLRPTALPQDENRHRPPARSASAWTVIRALAYC